MPQGNPRINSGHRQHRSTTALSRAQFWLVALLLSLTTTNALWAKTQVVMLGTGTPIPTPDRSGPGVAIVVDDVPYLVDFGPGIVRRAAAASEEYGGAIKGLNVDNIGRAFLTHLHHDHSAGLPDLVFTTWTHGRAPAFELYGPEGVKKMASHVMQAWEEDNRYRLYGLEPATSEGWKINAHEVTEGVVFEDQRVKVEAFRVKHGSWPNAFGYRFTTADKVIVISGDAALDANIEKYATGADILIHEVMSAAGLSKRTPFWQAYHNNNHTSGVDLAKLANRAKPKLLVLYHLLFFGASETSLLKEVTDNYKGKVVMANDLDVYD